MTYKSYKSNNKKATIIIVAIFFILQTANPLLWWPKEAQAVAPMPVVDAPATAATTGVAASEKAERTTKEVKETFGQKIFKGMILTAAVTLRNTLIMMSKRAAEQTVTYISTGSWGQGAMFYTEAWGVFKENLTYYIIGQFLDNLNAMFGIDICNPSVDLEFGLKLGLQFAWLKDPQLDKLKKPKCDLQKLSHNWGALIDGIRKKYEVIESYSASPYKQAYMTVAVLNEVFDVSFSQTKSDIGMKMTIEDKAREEEKKKREAEEAQRKENQGMQGITSPGGEFIQTPASFTKSHSESELEKAKATPQQEVETSKDVLTSIPGSIAVAFLNTFVSKMWTDYILKKFFEQGLANPSASFNPIQKTFDTSQNLQKEFALQKLNLTFAQKQIDLLFEYSTCPDERGLNNCVMDNGFAEAVRRATQEKPLTVQGAIDAGLLDGKKPFISQSDDLNKSDNCYESGYCYSNLVKLRRARIVPIGWEIAANRVEAGSDVSLNDMIAAFGDDKLFEGNFYKLVDPNWVLHYPETQCKATVTGPLLVASGASDRAETCADMVSCVKTNENGSCAAFGYCAAERNVFRFGGQQCQGAFDSCRTLEDRKGKTVNFLTNTVDSGVCDANNVGCKWFSTLKNIDSKQLVLNQQWSAKDEDKIYLNKKVEDLECSPNSDGCSRFIRTKAGLGTNLIPNGGFEIFDGNDGSWATGDLKDIKGFGDLTLTTDAYAGKAALLFNGNKTIESDSINIPPAKFKRFFVIKAMVKWVKKPVSPTFELALMEKDPVSAPSSLESIPPSFGLPSAEVGEWTEISRLYSFGGNVEQFNNSAVINNQFKIWLYINVASGQSHEVVIDNLSLEEVDEPSLESGHEYADYASQNEVFLKKAPDYLKCYNAQVAAGGQGALQVADALYGKPKTTSQIKFDDDVATTDKLSGCDKYAKLCAAEEVGCEAYKPTDDGATMNGIASYYDYCPKECAGYNTFSMSKTYFEDGEFPKFLIPSTAKQCNAANAGCDEFTNLDVLAAGGEAKEYYQELRHCAKLPDKQSSCSTFYTWEGSEVTGYQLQAHNLQKVVDATSPLGLGSPDIVNPAVNNPTGNSASCSAVIFNAKTNPDCRQFYDADGKVYYRLYSKTIFCSTDCHPFRRTLKYVNSTVGSTECKNRQGEWKDGECVFWAIPNQGAKCSAESSACREYRGNQAGIEFEVENYTFSEFGSALDKFIATSGSKLQTSPEYGQYLTVNPVSSNGIAKLNTNPAKLNFLPGDYRISFWLKANASPPPPPASPPYFWIDAGDFVNPSSPQFDKFYLEEQKQISNNWQFYTYNFTVQPIQSSVFGLGIGANAAFDIDNLKIVRTSDLQYLIKDSWKTPLACDKDLAGAALAQAQIGCREFEDREKTKHYLKSFSGLCASDKVGCEAVIDTQNTVNPFEKEISVTITQDEICRIASEEALIDATTNKKSLTIVGDNNQDVTVEFTHAKYIDGECLFNSDQLNTQKYFPVNSVFSALAGSNDSYYITTQTSGNLVTVFYKQTIATIKNDSLIYLVNDEKKQCPAEEKGCTALGLPTLTVDNDGKYVLKTKDNVEQWDTQFYKLDPESFEAADSPLCNAFEQGCEEYKDEAGSTYFFKNPGDKVCEYRKVSKGSEMEYGWYKKKINKDDDDVECGAKSKGYYNDGSQQLLKADDLSYSGWVGACPGSANMCTAFVDPTDTGLSEKGKAYYYLNNENIDKKTCSTPSRKEGCVLFNDTSLNPKDLQYEAFSAYSNKETITNDQIQFDTSISNVNCDSYTFCPWIAKCLEKGDKSSKECVDAIALADSNAALPGTQYYCSNQLGNDLVIAKKSAACTIKQLMQKNANTLIKVITDRECGAWYSCKSSHWNWNENTGKFAEVCDEIGLCDSLTGEGETLKCGNFINNKIENNLLTLNTSVEEGYAGRDSGWFSLDYSGLAIPYLAPVQFYNAFDLNADKKTCGGVANGTACTKNSECVGQTKCEKIELSDYRLVNQSNFQCEIDSDCNSPGQADTQKTEKVAFCVNDKCKCLNSVCVRPFTADGSWSESDAAGKAPECRGYPAKDAPFPSKDTDDIPIYENANKFYVDLANVKYAAEDFGCGYKKVPYGGGQIYKYVPWSAKYMGSIPDGVCQDDPEKSCSQGNCDAGAMKTGAMCTTKIGTSCGEGGTCLLKGATDAKKGKIIEFRGWEGYCLEGDQSIAKDNTPDKHPCLTWYPTYLLAGLQDLQNNYDLAGFWPAAYGFSPAGPYYCKNTSDNVFRSTWFAEIESYGFVGTGQCYTNLPKYIIGTAVIDKITKRFLAVPGGNYSLLNGVEIIVGKTKAYEVKGECKVTDSETSPVDAFNCLSSMCHSWNPPLITTEEICQGGNYKQIKQLSYHPTNLYDIDINEPSDSTHQMYFQCEPDGAGQAGKGWYYGSPAEYLEDPANHPFGFDQAVYQGNEHCTNNSNSAQCLWEGFSGGVDKNGKGWEIGKKNCNEIVAMAGENGENKAFTNRIYQGKIPGFKECQKNDVTLNPPETTHPVNREIGCGLFGAINFNKAPDNNNDFLTSTLKNIFFGDDENNDPSALLGNSTSEGKMDDNCKTINSIGNETTFNPELNVNPKDIWKDKGIYIGGDSCLGLDNFEVGFSGAYISSFNNYQKLYAKTYGMWRQNDAGKIISDNAPYEKITGSPWFGNVDVAYDMGQTRPPIVAGMMETGKNDSSGKPIYAAMPGKLTVSTGTISKTEGNIFGENGQLEVFVKFYGWAHDDQMPIRSVIVNWGDKNTTPVVEGKYQNHKPRCQREVGEKLGRCDKTGAGVYYGYACAPESDECQHLGKDGDGKPLKCIKDLYCDDANCKADWFGDTDEACKEGYFQYKHVYTCAGEGSEGWDGNKGACVFKLGVQLKDNWGWCNGDNGGAGEYESDCKLSSKEPWEYYDGAIYVKP